MILIVTIKDIAKRAGVSVATVSHVINKTRFVSNVLQERVKKAIEDLDYHPNVMAGSLRSRKTKVIGLSSMEPAGTGFVSRTYTSLVGFGGEPIAAAEFKELVNKPILRKR